MPQENSSIDINQLSVFLEQEKTLTAVDKVDFSLYRGETLSLLGETGCGKSLTALALMRLLPEIAIYGETSQIKVDSQDLLALPEFLMRELRGRKLAMIFQEPMTALNPVLTIGQQLGECLTRHQKFNHQELMANMQRLLTEVELSDPAIRIQQYPHQLSGGQKQRVVIAMALACNPSILIADEPTTALDVTIQAQILALLKRLQLRYAMSVLLITHDLGVVKAVADRVCVMYAGQIVEYAPVKDFFMQVKHPYAQQLLASLPSFAKRGQELQILVGSVPNLDNLPKGCRFHTRCAHVFPKCQHIEPQLQSLPMREVRCHLYPEHQSLPALPDLRVNWPFVKPFSAEPLLSFQQVSVHFRIQPSRYKQQSLLIKAVDEVSFVLKKGQTLALVGESGCGKTTIARAILRLTALTAGHIYYGNNEITKLRGKGLQQYRKQVQMIFQDPFSSMNPRMTVGEIIAEGMHAQGMSVNQIVNKQALLLEQVQLPKNSVDRYPHQFSGGQRQRICIARALATDPAILICDEPTSALDVSIQAQILNLLKQLQIEAGLSYLFITHNMEIVSYMADEVLVMKAGKTIEFGSCEKILYAPEAEYTKQLLAAVLRV
jgi:oligopeptide/dipeptide ABC transporter ATP-binding protein